MHKNHMPSVFKFGLSTKVTKKKAEKIRERDKRGYLRKNQKLENCIINIDDDDDIDFSGLGVGGDTVEDGAMYHCWCRLHLIIVSLNPFCQIISPPLPTIRKRYAGGRIFLWLMLSVKTSKTPMDTTRLLSAIRYLVMRILG